VEFANADIQVIDHLSKIHEKLKLESRRIFNSNAPFDRAKNQLQAMPEYQAFCEELLEIFYWKISGYKIELTIKPDGQQGPVASGESDPLSIAAVTRRQRKRHSILIRCGNHMKLGIPSVSGSADRLGPFFQSPSLLG